MKFMIVSLGIESESQLVVKLTTQCLTSFYTMIDMIF